MAQGVVYFIKKSCWILANGVAAMGVRGSVCAAMAPMSIFRQTEMGEFLVSLAIVFTEDNRSRRIGRGRGWAASHNNRDVRRRQSLIPPLDLRRSCHCFSMKVKVSASSP